MQCLVALIICCMYIFRHTYIHTYVGKQATGHELEQFEAKVYLSFLSRAECLVKSFFLFLKSHTGIHVWHKSMSISFYSSMSNIAPHFSYICWFRKKYERARFFQMIHINSLMAASIQWRPPLPTHVSFMLELSHKHIYTLCTSYFENRKSIGSPLYRCQASLSVWLPAKSRLAITYLFR